jgi:class 3 adenylate cyclase
MLLRDSTRVELDDAEQQTLTVDDARVDPVPDLPERKVTQVVEPAHAENVPAYDLPVLAERLLRIGADPSDDEDTRLDKVLILSAIAMIAPIAAVWGVLYLAVGAPRAAAIPLLYVAIAGAGVAFFAWSRSLRWLALTQFVPYALLPFVLMWVLGGFLSGSAVALWALFTPLAALVVLGTRAAAPWLVAFVALVVASAFIELDDTDELSANAVEAFFVLNLVGVTAVAFGFFAVLLGGQGARTDALRGLVRRYFSPGVASTLLAEPLELGGDVAEVSVLFADLRGFTAASERIAPDEAVRLLNRYFAIALPIVEAEGGTPIQLAGDQVMAIFNAPERHADHALRAARAALEIQRQIDPELGADELPRFGIGINTGPALVGNIGSESFFNFTAIGDTTNLAARLTAEAASGEVVLGPATAAALRAVARLTARPRLNVKGRAEPVEAFVLDELIASD